MSGDQAAAVLADTVREAQGRLVAWLAARWGDLAAAEDAMADAVCAALETWPVSGIPAQPETWLLTAAQRRLIDRRRHDRMREAHLADLVAAQQAQREAEGVPEHRLGVLLACAHPSLAEELHAPLMLQAVFGLDAARIASAFLVPPATMAQRLVRAKAKIRIAGIPLEPPDPDEAPERLAAVRAAIYVAFGDGRSPVSGEAVGLARLLARLAPQDPEHHGLLALLLLVQARQPAGRDDRGAFVPLDRQDPRRWHADLAHEGEAYLRLAARQRRPGRYQLEATIHAAHLAPLHGEAVPWSLIVTLYDALLTVAPSIGAQLARIGAVLHASGPAAARAELERLPDLPDDCQPAWAVRAHVLAADGDRDPAAAACRRAAGTTDDPALRAYFLSMAASLSQRGDDG